MPIGTALLNHEELPANKRVAQSNGLGSRSRSAARGALQGSRAGDVQGKQGKTVAAGARRFSGKGDRIESAELGWGTGSRR